MKKMRLVISLVLIAALALGAGIGTYAWFTSQATSTANTFRAGTLIVGARGDAERAFDQTFNIQLNKDNIQPGDVLTKGTDGYSTITVKNTGNLPMATFGRFTIANDNGLADDIKIMDYKVEFFGSDGVSQKMFYYKGTDNTYSRTDNFITNGIGVAGMATNMEDWVNGYGPMDFMTAYTPWDFEGLKPGESYKMTFKLVYDENATDQGTWVDLGYEVKGCQVNAEAMMNLHLENVPDSTITSSVYGDVVNYLR